MLRVRNLGLLVVVAAVVLGGAACSSDEEAATQSDRPTITFAEAPEGSTDLGLCGAYYMAQMKQIIGGEESFKRLPPAAIGKEGDTVTGESCAWERLEGNGDALSLRIEVRDFTDDIAGLEGLFTELKDGTIGRESVSEIGDVAFSSASDTTSLLQVSSPPYLLTLSTRSDGALEPLSVDTLKLLGTAGLERLP